MDIWVSGLIISTNDEPCSSTLFNVVTLALPEDTTWDEYSYVPRVTSMGMRRSGVVPSMQRFSELVPYGKEILVSSLDVECIDKTTSLKLFRTLCYKLLRLILLTFEKSITDIS